MSSDDDIFGDSEDDSTPIVSKKVISNLKRDDDKDIFEDSDSDQSKIKRQNKLRKGRITKRKKLERLPDDEPADKPRKKRQPNKNPAKPSDDNSSADEANEANVSDVEFDEDVMLKQQHKQKQEKYVRSKAVGNDPLSEMLLETRRTKSKPLTDEEKVTIVKNLIRKMEIATKSDEEERNHGKPALHKLSLCEAVQQAVSMTSLHQFLLECKLGESTFLGILLKWIDPSEKNPDVLPNLTLRTSVYNTLLILPCKADDLKRSGIGKVVAKLLKHPRESSSNKIILKNIFEKWNRLIFQKATDNTKIVGNNLGGEIKASITHQYAQSNSSSDHLETSISETQDKDKSSSQRARAPVSNGFMFTVNLQDLAPSGNIFASKQNAGTFSKRDTISKKLSELSAGGKKSNSRFVIILYFFCHMNYLFYHVLS